MCVCVWCGVVMMGGVCMNKYVNDKIIVRITPKMYDT